MRSDFYGREVRKWPCRLSRGHRLRQPSTTPQQPSKTKMPPQFKMKSCVFRFPGVRISRARKPTAMTSDPWADSGRKTHSFAHCGGPSRNAGLSCSLSGYGPLLFCYEAATIRLVEECLSEEHPLCGKQLDFDFLSICCVFCVLVCFCLCCFELTKP